MKILCVDDDLSTLTMISRSLERAFPEDEILSAPSGEEALEHLRKAEAEILITDLMMPGISGMDLLEQAKRECPDIEVIMITAYSSVASAVEATRKGARDYLPKPISVELLAEKVENLRELLISRREIEDYRYALRVIEEDVSRSARAYDLRLEELRGGMDQVREILGTELAAEEKVARIDKAVEAESR